MSSMSGSAPLADRRTGLHSKLDKANPEGWCLDPDLLVCFTSAIVAGRNRWRLN
ncbi:hypothetical protein H2248_000676 [Termitomyces sp. 'cryptogamus']|nr:hypothetical protein H2248_000676 [Termitomyces sp. 'cryptogamus']